MILVDTSLWIDHLHGDEAVLADSLRQEIVLVHKYVVGELALGHLRDRARVLRDLSKLPQAEIATHDDVLRLIDSVPLIARGIGYVDAHLIASVRLDRRSALMTRDRQLRAAALAAGVEVIAAEH